MASTGREDTWRRPTIIQQEGEEGDSTIPINSTSSTGIVPIIQTAGECEIPRETSITTDPTVPEVRGELPASNITMETSEDLNVCLRMLMGSKDVGGIIGKAGMTIKAFREESGAKINISNGTSSERLVTISGTKPQISKAFLAITRKIQEDSIQSLGGSDAAGEMISGLSIRLIIQASQCGSLIGKGGAKISEIRELTNVTIQVAGESLPNSTERTVTISGCPEGIQQCVEHISDIVLENPPKGPSIAYKPHTLPHNTSYTPRGSVAYQAPFTAFNTRAQTTIQHMRIPNDLIGCIIGRKGTKIHEIRVNSGAMIKIASNEGDGTDRLVTITGTPESVGIAQYLINSKIHSEVNSYLSIGLTTV